MKKTNSPMDAKKEQRLLMEVLACTTLEQERGVYLRFDQDEKADDVGQRINERDAELYGPYHQYYRGMNGLVVKL